MERAICFQGGVKHAYQSVKCRSFTQNDSRAFFLLTTFANGGTTSLVAFRGCQKESPKFVSMGN